MHDGEYLRRLGVPGDELDGVRVLRTPSEANYINDNCAAKHVVIVGGSFIGMEVGTSFLGKFSSTVLKSCINRQK